MAHVERLKRPAIMKVEQVVKQPAVAKGEELPVKRGAYTKVPVTMKALTQRINRVLRHDDEQLRKARGVRTRQDLGEWYVLDWNRNFIVRHHVDPEALGRKLGTLNEWEVLVPDEEVTR